MADFLKELESSLAPRKVSIEEFAESSDFCGKSLYPRQKLLLKLFFLEELSNREEDTLNYWMQGGRGGEIVLAPHIRKRIDSLRDQGFPHFREVVLVGGRRCSKGFVTGLAMAKKMFDTLQLEDPNTAYGIDPEKQIYFSCVAASLDQARKFQYSDLATTVSECHAFGDNLTKLYEKEFSVATEADLRKMAAHRRKSHKIGRDISKLRGNALAANASTIRGSTTMAIAFDEMAFMEVGAETDASAEKVYDAALPSLAQFGKEAMMFCNSSPYTKLGRFFERFQAGMAVEKDHPSIPLNPYMVSFQFPSWALFEGWWEEPLYKGPRKCITQSPDWDHEQKNEDGTYFFSEDDRIGIKLARDEEKQNPDTYKVERRGQFSEIIDAYLDPKAVDRMFEGVPAPDGSHIAVASNYTSPNGFLYEYRAHLDPSSTTAGFGFALGHLEAFPGSDGEPEEHVVFDIIKRWQPQNFESGVIEWETVLREVYGYIDLFRPTEITMDQFNSDAPIEWLNKELRMRNVGGVKVFKKSATSQSNWNRSEIFRTCLYRDLVHGPADTPDNRYCALELKYLQQISTGLTPRVDKQEIGPVQTKDMADCVMTVTESFLSNRLRDQMMASLGSTPLGLGALGGYPLAGGGPGNGKHPLFGQFSGGRAGEQSPGGSPASRARQIGTNPARSGFRARGKRRGF
ncbi:hypothetical protein [Candidatus Solirubrobacter pratensis]|uniref:hypothetical protein n=1 Tax=Candidatus Solirubrobacter pratensis TaxID=1298857 RepID=UPI00041BAF24|nr:hypothetical protein [Candidatus Solirubrobacter pratensis]